MNRMLPHTKFAREIFLGLVLVLASLGAWGQKPPADCSLVVVSRLLNRDTGVCDTKIVEQMAKSGRTFEQKQMGLVSTLVIGPDYSVKDAFAWFQRAAQRGYAPAQVNLALMYSNGWGTAVNFGAAQHWLREAASQHSARAYLNLGILYRQGKGVRQDDKEAFRWFQKGAEAGDSSAQTNLGYMYERGLGCARDVSMAATLYKKAAEAGNPLGENNFASLYLVGEGVPRNYAEAFAWFQKAAAQGHTGAQIQLGYMYANGQGTEKNPEQAYVWIKAAQDSGDNRGVEMLRSLENILNAKRFEEAQEQASKIQLAVPKISASSLVQ